MKKLFHLLCAVMLLGACTKTDCQDNPINVNTNFFVGTWLYTHHDGRELTSGEQEIDVYYADGNNTYAYPADGKWVEVNQKYKVEGNKIYYSETGTVVEIVSINNKEITLKHVETGKVYTAKKINSRYI